MIITANQAAFLSMIAHSEGTDRASDPYRVCFSFRHTIADLSDHPVLTGEWQGESIANLGAQYVGKISTAAGRYQITKPTWLALKAQLKLHDFLPASQDAAALGLIRQRGALDFVNVGDVPAAVAKCGAVWASLPSSTANQPTRSLGSLVRFYASVGGHLASYAVLV